ncbi:FecR family protein [Methylococcus sp. EFPC2]|uniref:FecR family protein n=1 Tax=Methylococcus sp. EFPC2 TaxID=2812648 RepID=UPI0019680890|nr:FecR family protein [Methylococcus sp. EFPC2]QSA96006.1 FecR family protein [Methylococcus sp. EFPC2]
MNDDARLFPPASSYPSAGAYTGPGAERDATAAPLSDQAIDWVVVAHSGQANEDDRRRLAAWKMQSPEHRQAYDEALRLWADMGEALDDSAPAIPPRRPVDMDRHAAMRRRRPAALAAAAAILLAVIGGLLHGLHYTDPLLSDYYTRTGERRELNLADGSRIVLDTETAIDVGFDQSGRRIRLLHGRARFQVAADPARPFEVTAGAGVTRALGTVFDVRQENGRVRVTVQEHAVAVRAKARPDLPARVEAGQQLSYSDSGEIERAVPVDLSVATAWQRHKLIFRERPLAEVVGELNRYRKDKVLLVGPALNQIRVTGVFPLDDGDDALQTVTSTLSLQLTRIGPLALLHR